MLKRKFNKKQKKRQTYTHQKYEGCKEMLRRVVLKGYRSIVIVGLIGLLYWGSSGVLPELKIMSAGWWLQQQSLPQIVYKTKKVRVKEPKWYLRFKRIIDSWRRWLNEEKLIWGLSYLLMLLLMGWIWLLQRLLSRMMRAEGVSDWQGNWGWNGELPNQSGVIQVRLQVTISELWLTDRPPVSQQLCLETSQEEVETVIESRTAETSAQMSIVSRAAYEVRHHTHQMKPRGVRLGTDTNDQA